MDNDARMKRITALVADVNACQLDAISHQQNFKNVSEIAYAALQDYLKSKNMKTTDELVQEVISALPPEEQQKILDHLKELTPKTGLDFFLQPSELAKFMLFGYITSNVNFKAVANPVIQQVKAWYNCARSNVLLGGMRTGQAVSAGEKAVANLAQADREAILSDLKNECSTLEKEGLAAEGAEVEQAAKTVKNIEAAEADSLAVAGKMTVWTKACIVVSVVAIIGLEIWDKVKEKQIADELHETIAKVATARLYARIAERMELTHTDQMSTIQMLAQAYVDKDEDAQKFLQKNFAKVIQNALDGIDENNTYEMLKKQDITSNADTREDPSLDDMKKRRAEDAKKNLPNRPVSSM